MVVVRTKKQTQEVRHEQSDEPDHSSPGHGGRRQDRAYCDDDRTVALDGNAQLLCRFVAERKSIETSSKDKGKSRSAEYESGDHADLGPLGHGDSAEQPDVDYARVDLQAIIEDEKQGHGIAENDTRGKSSQQKGNDRRPACDSRKTIHRDHGQKRAQERERRNRPEAEHREARGKENAQSPAERSTTGGSDHERVCHGIAEQTLKEGACNGERGTYQGRSENTRQAYVEENHVVSRRPVRRSVSQSEMLQQDGHNLTSGDGDRTCSGRQHRDHKEGEQQTGYPKGKPLAVLGS